MNDLLYAIEATWPFWVVALVGSETLFYFRKRIARDNVWIGVLAGRGYPLHIPAGSGSDGYQTAIALLHRELDFTATSFDGSIGGSGSSPSNQGSDYATFDPGRDGSNGHVLLAVVDSLLDVFGWIRLSVRWGHDTRSC